MNPRIVLLKLYPVGCSSDNATVGRGRPQGSNTFSQLVQQHGHIDIGGFMHRFAKNQYLCCLRCDDGLPALSKRPAPAVHMLKGITQDNFTRRWVFYFSVKCQMPFCSFSVSYFDVFCDPVQIECRHRNSKNTSIELCGRFDGYRRFPLRFFSLSIFCLFDQFKQGDHFGFGGLFESSFPFGRCQGLFKERCHLKMLKPAVKGPVTGEPLIFLDAIGKINLIS